jgi:hypothetical protein
VFLPVADKEGLTAESAKTAEKKEKMDSCFRRNDSIKNLCELSVLCGKS